MTKLKEFRIELEKPGATYEPGEVVAGKVIVNLSGPKNVREIRLEAKGEAETHWTHRRTDKDISGRKTHVTDHYRGHEHYFSVSNRLVGGTGGDSQTTLPAGLHSYHFSFHLPQNIPSSVEHTYGYIRYTIKAVLDRPWRFDHKVVTAFTVNEIYDLNTQQELTKGISDEISNKFWCCFFSAGRLAVNARSKVTGYVPGETIELNVNFENTSNRVDLTFIKLKLVKHSKFFTTTPRSDSKSDMNVITKYKYAGPFDKKGEASLKINVPALPPSRLDNCSIISIKYQLLLTVGVSGCHRNLSKSYPIEIGTVPLFYNASAPIASVTSNVPSAPLMDQMAPNTPLIPQTQPEAQGNQPIGFVFMNPPPYPAGGMPRPMPQLMPQPMPQSMPQMPPPSYEECISGSNIIADVNEQGMHGSNVQFAPRYPVYKFPMPMPYPP